MCSGLLWILCVCVLEYMSSRSVFLVCVRVYAHVCVYVCDLLCICLCLII